MPLFSARCSSGSSSWPVVRSAAERPVHAAVQLVLGDQRAGLGLRHQDRRAGVLQRADAVQHRVVEHDARLQAAGQHEAADAESGRREDLDPLAVVRRVGDDEGAVGLDRERRRVDDLARLAADRDDRPRARHAARRGRRPCGARRSKTKYWPEADCWNPAGSRNCPATCAGTAPDERRTSGASASTEITKRKKPPRTQRPRRTSCKITKL